MPMLLASRRSVWLHGVLLRAQGAGNRREGMSESSDEPAGGRDCEMARMRQIVGLTGGLDGRLIIAIRQLVLRSNRPRLGCERGCRNRVNAATLAVCARSSAG